MRLSPSTQRKTTLFALSIAASMVLALTTAAAATQCDGVSAAGSSSLATVRIASGLTKPTYVTAPPGDTHRVFILEQDGRIRIVKDGLLLGPSFLDVDALTQSTGNEEGLLGLAFSPSYPSDGIFFIYHTDNGGGSNTVARYQVSANPDLADVASRRAVLSVPHPTNSNHNGGGLQFGPDGMLYIGPGDGGSACDPPNNAQNTSELKGKLLRISVLPPIADPGPYYTIPVDNPGFPRGEVWSYGLRNPWRFSFDRFTQDLYIADVGQDTWEEIDYRPYPGIGKGDNFGWERYEGCVCPPTTCGGVCNPIATRVDPVKVYSLAGTPCAVMGGYVYRGCRMPTLAAEGRYFYGDHCSTTSYNSFVVNSGGIGSCGSAIHNEINYSTQITPSLDGFAINNITSWGEDAQGELYITDRGTLGGGAGVGEVFKIVPLLSNMELSAQSAVPFKLGTNWTWEDLWLSSSHPIHQYRIYRMTGTGTGPYTCVFKTPPPVAPARGPVPVWNGGDPAVPLPGEVFSYVVTAVRLSPTVEESSPGTGTGGSPRILSAAVCP